jgi:hypothetical protein
MLSFSMPHKPGVTMLKNNNELYTLIDELCETLPRHGAAASADELKRALSVSSLPGEVLGEVGRALNRLARLDPYSHPDVRDRVDEAAAYLRAVLASS